MAIYECRVKLTGGSGTGPFYNIFHVDGPSPALQSDVDKMVTPFETFYDAIKGHYPTNMVINIFDRVLTVEDPPQIMTPTPTTVTGVGSGGQAPPQIAAVISWVTSLAGAGYRGRTYLGPLAGSMVASNGQLDPSTASAIATAATTLMGDLNAAAGASQYRLGVYSRVHATFTPYLTAIVHPTARTQRRRN